MSQWNIEEYKNEIDRIGIEEVWKKILKDSLLDIKEYGYFYEAGLAYTNKISKKEQGKYYTPEDVAKLLVIFLNDLEGENICDVCCGTGNLIRTYLEEIGYQKAKEIITDGRIYLYDQDALALKIAKGSLAKIYGEKIVKNIHYICSDFLDQNIHLPEHAKVLSNPPYSAIKQIKPKWKETEIAKKTKEYYSIFMEKIITESESSVIITPFTYLGGKKYEPLRVFMDNYSGMVFSFDNVPGNIFKGQKQGVFNTNSTNSVRASITIVESIKEKQGFRISPLIRFKSEERERVLNKDVLMKLLPETRQRITTDQRMYYKVFKELEPIYNQWREEATGVFGELLTREKTKYSLTIPTTCRYFTTATICSLNRTGKHILYFKDEDSRDYGYCLFNSSFAYWFWRIFDGSITYPEYLLRNIPIKYDKELIKEHKEQIKKIQSKETTYITKKLNAKQIQENVKFPETIRSELNEIMFTNFDLKEEVILLDRIHQNNILKEKESIK